MELKWILAIVLEAGFWIMLAAFLVLRYRYGMEGITRLFVVGIVALGVWDFARTGEVSGYTLFIAALLAYALTWGKKDLRRLDAWMARKVRPRRTAGGSGPAGPGRNLPPRARSRGAPGRPRGGG